MTTDPKDALIRELDADLATARKALSATTAARDHLDRVVDELTRRNADLELRLAIATELSVVDRTRMEALEVALREALQHWRSPKLTHEEKARHDEIWKLVHE